MRSRTRTGTRPHRSNGRGGPDYRQTIRVLPLPGLTRRNGGRVRCRGVTLHVAAGEKHKRRDSDCPGRHWYGFAAQPAGIPSERRESEADRHSRHATTGIPERSRSTNALRRSRKPGAPGWPETLKPRRRARTARSARTRNVTSGSSPNRARTGLRIRRSRSGAGR